MTEFYIFLILAGICAGAAGVLDKCIPKELSNWSELYQYIVKSKFRQKRKTKIKNKGSGENEEIQIRIWIVNNSICSVRSDGGVSDSLCDAL